MNNQLELEFTSDSELNNGTAGGGFLENSGHILKWTMNCYQLHIQEMDLLNRIKG